MFQAKEKRGMKNLLLGTYTHSHYRGKEKKRKRTVLHLAKKRARRKKDYCIFVNNLLSLDRTPRIAIKN